MIKNKIERQLDENQARKQAGFRCGYSTTNHLKVMQKVDWKTCEYELPLCLAFVDYKKAFDLVEHTEVIKALKFNQIDRGYIEILVNSYNNGTAQIKLDMESCKFQVLKGVRQGDIMSPKLFNAGLEQLFRRLEWDNKGIRSMAKD